MIDRLGQVDWRRLPLLRTLWPIPRRLTCALALPLLAATIRLRIVGLEHVPGDGPLLVASNHLHNADPLLLGLAMPRPIHFMAKRELYANPIGGWMLRRAGAFPVDRGRADRSAILTAEDRLRRGFAVGLFPEGTRSKTGWLQAAHAGAGLIALRSGAPILPVAITGTERLPFNGLKRRSDQGCPRTPIRVVIRFGQPFTLEARTEGRRLTSAEATDEIMAAIGRLLPDEYRGERRAAGASGSPAAVS
ncbi:MAG TPA: lysophospholipid acyltransferase family protein [Thermomicrobiales bacterium]|nr:lysophospholipid acyltransferase family protein [Thermomicrobiales bacterium]